MMNELETKLNRKADLVEAKKDIELSLSEIRSEIRSSGYMDRGKYKELCEKQNINKRKQRHIEGELIRLKKEIRILSNERGFKKKVDCPECGAHFSIDINL